MLFLFRSNNYHHHHQYSHRSHHHYYCHNENTSVEDKDNFNDVGDHDPWSGAHRCNSNSSIERRRRRLPELPQKTSCE